MHPETLPPSWFFLKEGLNNLNFFHAYWYRPRSRKSRSKHKKFTPFKDFDNFQQFCVKIHYTYSYLLIIEPNIHEEAWTLNPYLDWWMEGLSTLTWSPCLICGSILEVEWRTFYHISFLAQVLSSESQSNS